MNKTCLSKPEFGGNGNSDKNNNQRGVKENIPDAICSTSTQEDSEEPTLTNNINELDTLVDDNKKDLTKAAFVGSFTSTNLSRTVSFCR